MRRFKNFATKESESDSSWFKQNKIIFSAAKFQDAVLNKKECEAKYKLAMDSIDIRTTRSVKLLKIAIDECISFDKYLWSFVWFGTICRIRNNVKNTHERVLLIITLLSWCFWCFLNYTNSIKSPKASHISKLCSISKMQLNQEVFIDYQLVGKPW